MNTHAKPTKFAAPQNVTTGPIAGSHKVYAAPKGRPDIAVPFREITLSDANEPPVRVYDPSGPYTESDARDRSRRGAAAGARRLDRSAGATPPATAAPIKPEDNGNVSAEHLAPLCPAKRMLRAGAPGQLVTQFEFARAGIVTEEMIYVAHRENLAREAAVDNAPRQRSPTARASAPKSPNSSRRNSCARRSRGAARSFPPTSITSNSSRWRSAAISSSRSTPISAIRAV